MDGDLIRKKAITGPYLVDITGTMNSSWKYLGQN
jgi:hypothetical protein